MKSKTLKLIKWLTERSDEEIRYWKDNWEITDKKVQELECELGNLKLELNRTHRNREFEKRHEEWKEKIADSFNNLQGALEPHDRGAVDKFFGHPFQQPLPSTVPSSVCYETPLKNPSGMPGWQHSGTGYNPMVGCDVLKAEPQYRLLNIGEVMRKVMNFVILVVSG